MATKATKHPDLLVDREDGPRESFPDASEPTSSRPPGERAVLLDYSSWSRLRRWSS